MNRREGCLCNCGAHEDYDALSARLAEAVECCTIKDNRNLWLEIRLKKIMARCADLLDEDQFNELDALARTAVSADPGALRTPDDPLSPNYDPGYSADEVQK